MQESSPYVWVSWSSAVPLMAPQQVHMTRGQSRGDSDAQTLFWGFDSHVRGECKERKMEAMEGWEDCPSSLLVGDASLPGCQHVVEGISANAGPGEEANQRTAMK